MSCGYACKAVAQDFKSRLSPPPSPAPPRKPPEKADSEIKGEIAGILRQVTVQNFLAAAVLVAVLCRDQILNLPCCACRFAQASRSCHCSTPAVSFWL